MAFGVLRAVREAGLRVPDDLSLAGFDGIPAAFLTTPPLTTIDQPKYEMGQCAAELLIAHIHKRKGPGCQRTIMEHRLIVGGSTAPPPDRD